MYIFLTYSTLKKCHGWARLDCCFKLQKICMVHHPAIYINDIPVNDCFNGAYVSCKETYALNIILTLYTLQGVIIIWNKYTLEHQQLYKRAV